MNRLNKVLIANLIICILMSIVSIGTISAQTTYSSNPPSEVWTSNVTAKVTGSGCNKTYNGDNVLKVRVIIKDNKSTFEIRKVDETQFKSETKIYIVESTENDYSKLVCSTKKSCNLSSDKLFATYSTSLSYSSGTKYFCVISEYPNANFYSGRIAITASATNCTMNVNSFNASEIDYNSFVANWESVSGATSYLINVKLASAADYSNAKSFTSNSNSVKVTGLDPCTEYKFQVKPNCGNWSSSSVNSFKTTPKQPVIWITSPVSGAYMKGQTVNIQWKSSFPSNLNDIVLQYAPNNTSGDPITIKTGLSTTNTSFIWAIGDNIPVGSGYIKIYSAGKTCINNLQQTNNTISIISQPETFNLELIGCMNFQPNLRELTTSSFTANIKNTGTKAWLGDFYLKINGKDLKAITSISINPNSSKVIECKVVPPISGSAKLELFYLTSGDSKGVSIKSNSNCNPTNISVGEIVMPSINKNEYSTCSELISISEQNDFQNLNLVNRLFNKEYIEENSSTGAITSSFLSCRASNNNCSDGANLHKGIDFRATIGVPVYAIMDGVITKEIGGSHGKIGIYNKEKNITAFYYHMSKWDDVIPGQIVLNGITKIGETGKTYPTTISPHLHFEIRNGSQVSANETAPSCSESYDPRIASNINPLPINDRIEIFAGSHNNPKPVKIRIRTIYSISGGQVYDFRINNKKLDINPTLTSNGIDHEFDVNISPNFVTNSGNYDIEFRVRTRNGAIFYFFGKNQLYFLSSNDLICNENQSCNAKVIPYDAWYKPYAKECIDLGIIKGTPEGYFDGNALMTRAQAAKVLVTAAATLGLRQYDVMYYNHLGNFEDVVPSDWHFPYIQTLRNWSATDGSPCIQRTEKFMPESPVTIGQFAKMICNVFNLTHFDKNINLLRNNGIINSKKTTIVFPNSNDMSLKPYIELLSSIMVLREDNSNYYTEPLIYSLAGVDYSSSNQPVNTINGDANVSRKMMVKIISNIYNYRKAIPSGTSKLSGSLKSLGYSSNEYDKLVNYSVIGDKFEIINDENEKPISQNFGSITLKSGEQKKWELPYNDRTFYYWCSDGGELKDLSGNYNHNIVTYTAPVLTTDKTYNLYIYQGNFSGRYREYFIKVNIKAESGSDDGSNNNGTVQTPTVQASELALSVKNDNSITLNWKRGNGNNVILIVSENNQLNVNVLEDGVKYRFSNSIKEAPMIKENVKAVYIGKENTTTITELSPNVKYFFYLYEFNTDEVKVKYLTNNAPMIFYCLDKKYFSFIKKQVDISIGLTYNPHQFINRVTNSIMEAYNEGADWDKLFGTYNYQLSDTFIIKILPNKAIKPIKTGQSILKFDEMVKDSCVLNVVDYVRAESISAVQKFPINVLFPFEDEPFLINGEYTREKSIDNNTLSVSTIYYDMCHGIYKFKNVISGSTNGYSINLNEVLLNSNIPQGGVWIEYNDSTRLIPLIYSPSIIRNTYLIYKYNNFKATLGISFNYDNFHINSIVLDKGVKASLSFNINGESYDVSGVALLNLFSNSNYSYYVVNFPFEKGRLLLKNSNNSSNYDIISCNYNNRNYGISKTSFNTFNICIDANSHDACNNIILQNSTDCIPLIINSFKIIDKE